MHVELETVERLVALLVPLAGSIAIQKSAKIALGFTVLLAIELYLFFQYPDIGTNLSTSLVLSALNFCILALCVHLSTDKFQGDRTSRGENDDKSSQ